ncbi:flagellar biosynthesis protein FlhF [Ideonella paludis]|uniref:Flagellar biosynthesis protein FlhF n=2 Tax=Ideonella paludis TaxID=1233411 RepID=A0ABS5DXJ7_9BURK|nr:flagellar biosynthesis protein FlhF [Ideonella paludis]MBQ0935880.1 flagellar biosynthesis protein FlhF [Ideonella paludis]
MNVKRFTARTSREAFALVRQAFGEDAVVLSTRPAAEGVEVTAMSPDSLDQIEKVAANPEPERAAPSARARGDSLASRVERANAQRSLSPSREEQAAAGAGNVEEDVAQLSMSTLSFQDYVRERMLKRRQQAMNPEAAAPTPAPAQPRVAAAAPALPPAARMAAPAPRAAATPAPAARPAPTTAQRLAVPRLQDEISIPTLGEAVSRREEIDMVNELRSMKGLIEERFGALAFMEKLQREPRQALLAQKLLDIGFSPGLIRRMVDALPAQAHDELAWATTVLERNLLTGEAEPALEEQGGVFALIGSTGVGKTTSTAKLAAAFATQYGAANLGLVTLDAYRVGAHEQLRTYGRILGVPVHTAHDRASLEDLLDLLSGKRMVLIDTAGMAQRDSRTRELLEMLSHPSISRLLVLDAAAQGETIDDVITNWRAAQCKGVILSKIDEAVKLAPALDALIRHKLKVLGVANGQRVPEDWHRLSSNALLQRAMRGGGAATYRMEAADVQLIFAAASHAAPVTHGMHV